MNLFGVLDISASALTAERERAEVVASNLANAETTSTPGGGPYKKQLVVFGTEQPGQGKFAQTLSRFGDLHARGVKVEKVVAGQGPGRAPVRARPPGCGCRRVRLIPQHQSSGRDGEPDGGRPGIPVERSGSAGHQGNDLGNAANSYVGVTGVWSQESVVRR